MGLLPKIHSEGLEPKVRLLGGEREWRHLLAARGPALTCNSPKVDISFMLPNGEGHDVLGAISMKMHGAQLLDALVGQYTNPALCSGQHGASGPGVWTWALHPHFPGLNEPVIILSPWSSCSVW